MMFVYIETIQVSVIDLNARITMVVYEIVFGGMHPIRRYRVWPVVYANFNH